MVDKMLVLSHIDSSQLYKTGHMANRWFGELSRQLARNVRAAAPKRTGGLKAGIHGSMKTFAKAQKMEHTLTSLAPYTLFVLRGTVDKESVIVSDGYPDKKMGPLAPYGGHEGGYRLYVSGQRSNNFLSRGWRKTAIRHGTMRPTPRFIKNP